MRLIPDWRLAWRFLSVQAAVLLALLSGIQGEVLPLFAPLFPDHLWPYISGGLALAIVVLRLVAQDGLASERAVLSLDELERKADELTLGEWMAEDAAEGAPHQLWEQALPAGRFERWLGAVLGLVIVVAVLGIVGVVWLALRGPSA